MDIKTGPLYAFHTDALPSTCANLIQRQGRRILVMDNYGGQGKQNARDGHLTEALRHLNRRK
jgi:hypothetical protein